MKRQIIKIDEEKCIGCEKCVSACHEGAIGMVNGKAKLLRDDYCDGLGNCLPACPTGAISFEEREAKPFDAQTVKKRMERLLNMDIKDEPDTHDQETVDEEANIPCGCPGSNAKTIELNNSRAKENEICNNNGNKVSKVPSFTPSQLRQWPVQIKLVPVNAPYFENADLLVAADCSAYSCGDFHNKYMKGKVVIIGCPKLDNIDYTEKLAAIIKNNNIKSLTVVRMEVPCCAGIVFAAQEAVKLSGKEIKTEIVTLKIGN
ncbi:MAG: 4Fe-4S binding protein [Endomicrobia bacterium]|nr:4Fe-4S binding protein [Endomicrobiia bacterium]